MSENKKGVHGVHLPVAVHVALERAERLPGWVALARPAVRQVASRAQVVFGSPFTSRNNYWKALMDLAKGCNRNFIAIHHASEVWGSDGPTGELIAGGDKLVETEVDVTIQTMRSPGEIARDSKGKPVIGPNGKAKMDINLALFVRDCRGNSSLREMELPWMPWDDFIGCMNTRPCTS